MSPHRADLSPDDLSDLLQGRVMSNFLGAGEGLFKQATGGDGFDFYLGAIKMMIDRIGVMCCAEKPMQDLLRAVADQHCSFDERNFIDAKAREQEAIKSLREAFNRMHGPGSTPGVRLRWPNQKNSARRN